MTIRVALARILQIYSSYLCSRLRRKLPWSARNKTLSYQTASVCTSTKGKHLAKTSSAVNIIALSIILSACRGGTDPQLFVLNPNPVKTISYPQKQPLRIGIDAVTLPEYLDHSQIIIFLTPNEGTLLEQYQWAESLKSNVTRVLQTNLSNQLPHSAIQTAPWDSQFFPQCHLHIDITQFKVDKQGNSALQAIYYIESNNQLTEKHRVQFAEKISTVNPKTMVISMNRLLNQLSNNIARTLSKVSL